MRRTLAVLVLVVLVLALTVSVSAAAGAPVYTVTYADLGQGCSGGAALFAGGGAQGGAACSEKTMQGQVAFKLVIDGWSQPDAKNVTIYYTVVPLQGEPFLQSGSITLPVTGRPIIEPSMNGGRTLIRVTPVH